MKQFLLALSLLSSTAALAQSYILQDTGRLLTIDRLGNLYDLSQSVQTDRVKNRGKNWIKTKDEMITITETGLVQHKGDLQLPKIKEQGGSWMIGDNNTLMIVGRDGTVYTTTAPVLDKAKVVTKGDNFVILRNRDRSSSILTFDLTNGNFYVGPNAVMRDQNPGLNLDYIKDNGGNWFTDVNGRLYVVTANGSVMNKRELGAFFGLSGKGGNFFHDSRGGIDVVLDNGLVVLPYLPLDFGGIVKSGPNYGWNTQGDFFTFAESVEPQNALAGSNNDVMDRLLRVVIKKTVEQPDPRTVFED